MTIQFDPRLLEFWRNAFEAYVTGDKGLVPIENLEPLIRSVGYNPSEEEINEMVDDLKDEEGIDFDAFTYIIYHHSRYADPEEELLRAFQLFDSEGTGKLSYSTVRNILKDVKKPFTEEQIEKTIEKAGDIDGEIKIESLVSVLLNN